MSNSNSLFQASLGAEIEGAVLPISQWVIPKRVYKWAIRWDAVQISKDGSYIWAGRHYDDNALALQGHEQIITVKGCPEWARLWPIASSPPKPEFYPDAAKFINAVQDRYNPKAIEFYNEVDCISGTGEPEFFGAWVGPNETWSTGGKRYGNAVAQIYPLLRAKLLVGALMMHDYSLEFLTGALHAGLKGDAISFHCYVHNPNEFEKPMRLADEISYIARVCEFNVPLVMTETSVTGPVNTEELRKWQVDYLTKIIPWKGVILKIWYTLANNCWVNSDLIDRIPKPVYQVWKDA